MNDFSPLEKRLRDNESTQNLKIGLLGVAAMFMVVLLVVIAIFGDDVKDSLKGYQEINDRQTKTILEQTNIIQGQNKVIQRQNQLIECLVRKLKDCEDEEQSVNSAERQQPTPQANPQPQPGRGQPGKQGPAGDKGERGDPGPVCTINFLGVCI